MPPSTRAMTQALSDEGSFTIADLRKARTLRAQKYAARKEEKKKLAEEERRANEKKLAKETRLALSLEEEENRANEARLAEEIRREKEWADRLAEREKYLAFLREKETEQRLKDARLVEEKAERVHQKAVEEAERAKSAVEKAKRATAQRHRQAARSIDDALEENLSDSEDKKHNDDEEEPESDDEPLANDDEEEIESEDDEEDMPLRLLKEKLLKKKASSKKKKKVSKKKTGMENARLMADKHVRKWIQAVSRGQKVLIAPSFFPEFNNRLHEWIKAIMHNVAFVVEGKKHKGKNCRGKTIEKNTVFEAMRLVESFSYKDMNMKELDDFGKKETTRPWLPSRTKLRMVMLQYDNTSRFTRVSKDAVELLRSALLLHVHAMLKTIAEMMAKTGLKKWSACPTFVPTAKMTAAALSMEGFEQGEEEEEDAQNWDDLVKEVENLEDESLGSSFDENESEEQEDVSSDENPDL